MQSIMAIYKLIKQYNSNHLILNNMITGTKTQFFTDVKIDIRAGMPLGKKTDYKIKKVGYDIYRHYYDSHEKDCQVGVERTKRIIY